MSEKNPFGGYKFTERFFPFIESPSQSQFAKALLRLRRYQRIMAIL